MNYSGKKIAITGVSGFLGKALAYRLASLTQQSQPKRIDWDDVGRHKVGQVVFLSGDVRNPETFDRLDHTFDYLFHFAAPSSQVLFKRGTAYCIESTLNGLFNAAQAAKTYGIRLIYPSTGLLSQDRYNEYAMCKKISEDYVNGLGMDALGIRIFATYGPGEGHKADYASVPYLFARDMVAGRAPVVYGDGEQVRDFIYIRDVVEAIVYLAEECHEPTIDLGSGEQTSFNQILADLKELTGGPGPVYVDAPAGYVKETAANIGPLKHFYKPQFSLNIGLRETVEHLKAIKESKGE